MLTCAGADPTELAFPPAQLATPACIAVFKRLGMRHEQTSQLAFLQACSRRFTQLIETMSTREPLATSILLVAMLRRITDAAAVTPGSILGTLPIFLTADLQCSQLPWPKLVSLDASQHFVHNDLVATTVPITSRALLNTQPLRSKLRLPIQPRVQDVASHLVNLASDTAVQLIMQQKESPMKTRLLGQLRSIYAFIFDKASQCLESDSSPSDIASVTETLKQGAWVLLQDDKFVQPCQLCFNAEEDSDMGEALSWATAHNFLVFSPM